VRAGLVEEWLSVMEASIELDLDAGRYSDVLVELTALTAAHPLRERLWAQRMLALYRSGRQAEALECYRALSRILTDELGIGCDRFKPPQPPRPSLATPDRQRRRDRRPHDPRQPPPRIKQDLYPVIVS
jgi:hypothetical protein